MEVANLVFNILIGVGISIPFISILLGGMGTIFGIDLDFDGDTNFDCLLPFNFMCFMFGLAIFGITGRLLANLLCSIFPFIINMVITVPVCLLVSTVSYKFMLRHVVAPLRKNDAFASRMSDFIGSTGTVVTAIPTNAFGEVSLSDNVGGKINYFAVSSFDEGIEPYILKVGTKVKVLFVDKDRSNTFIVKELETSDDVTINKKS